MGAAGARAQVSARDRAVIIGKGGKNARDIQGQAGLRSLQVDAPPPPSRNRGARACAARAA